MLKDLYPYEYADDVYSIDYKELYRQGYRGIIFDIDNTLVHHGDDSNEKVDRFFADIQSIGFKTCILSNNDQARVERFLKNIDSQYICDADKPEVSGFLRAVKKMGIKRSEAICIGDQVFTDVYGANKSGLANILVKFIRAENETSIGKRRQVENLILKMYMRNKKYTHRLGDIIIKREEERKVAEKKNNFSDMNPVFFALSTFKGILIRDIKDLFSKERFARGKKKKKLPNVVSDYNSTTIKTGPGIDPVTQENKAVNIKLASARINSIIIKPGETYSFWRTVGPVNKRRGYKEGRVIERGRLVTGTGGGLCNLANTINNLVLRSPLEITEFHKHSDALASDIGHRVPMANGTSVSYNYIDYRFRNNTDQNVQILLWSADGKLYGELRSEHEFPYRYEITEEGHHFEREGEDYYRVSKIYKNTIDKATGEVKKKELIWDNHSMVMFDPGMIPEDELVVKE